MNKIFKVKCPQCATIFSYYESAFRPFCSERCKLIDLGHWFEETYRVPEKDPKQSETEDYDQEENFEQTYSEEDENGYEH